MHKLVPRFGLKNLLILSLYLAVIRWFLIGYFPDILSIAIFAQLFHAATFGIYHATAIQLIHEYFPGHHQGKGQALYSSLSFGAGGAFGSFYAGYTWETLGGSETFLLSMILPVLAIIVAMRSISADAGHTAPGEPN